MASQQNVSIHQPETACEESALAWRQAVVGAFGCITQDEAVDREMAFNGFDGAANARILRRQETDFGKQKQAGVKLGTVIGLHEAAQLCIVAALTNLRMGLR